jgi:hypothetical protein
MCGHFCLQFWLNGRPGVKSAGFLNPYRMVYFVGIHNKPGMTALDSRTHTGRIIDNVIERIGGGIKTNLADTDEMPEDIAAHAVAWHKRHTLADGDTVVLLGRLVQKNFIRVDGAYYVNAAHPSAFAVRNDRSEYILALTDALPLLG